MININTGFHVGAALPLDDRSYLTKAQMLAINENIYPDYFLAICSEDGFVYMFDKSIDVADVDPQTGKFKLFVGDVEEAIRILNGNVDTEGSVLYSIFNNAKNAEYQTVTKNIYTVNMSDFGTSDIIITPEQKQSAEDGETVEIATGYELTYNSTNTEYTVTKVSDSESHIVTLTAGTTDEITTLKQKIDAVKEEAEVELREYTLPADITPGYLKTYELFQNNVSLGKIDIPKDLVVTSGTVETYTEETLPTGKGAPTVPGTYIVLTIANKDASKLYIAADKLVDIYKPQQGATQIQLTISTDNVISALIVAGSVGTTELADSAVTTAKIADKNVTLAKLSDTVQASLGLADSAVQESDITALKEELERYEDMLFTGIVRVGIVTENDEQILTADGESLESWLKLATSSDIETKDKTDDCYLSLYE